MTERRHPEDAETQPSGGSDASDAHEAETVVQRHSRSSAFGTGAERSSTGASQAGTTLGTGRTAASRITGATLVSPDAALWEQEIARMRIFLVVIVSIGAFMGFWVGWIIDMDPVARHVAIVAIVAVVVPTAAMRIAIRDPVAYTETRITALAIVCVVGTTVVVYSFGVYSPAVVTTMFGVVVYAPSKSRIGTLLVCVVASLCYAVLAVGVGAGWLPDRGIVASAHLGWLEQVTIVIAVESFYVAAYVLGRASRAVTLRALEERDKATRALAQREALLVEARQELEEALRVGGLGRYTDQDVGSFRLGAVLGRGGMGDVYEATHRDTGERAAVKLMHSRALGNPSLVRRFMREATVVSSLDAPNVVRVLEVGGLEAGVPYIAMERLEGEDLAEILRDKRRIPLKRVVKLVRDVAVGLEAAVAAGIVHRDIKPRNLFRAVAEDGSKVWKILDFGVSKLSDHGAR